MRENCYLKKKKRNIEEIFKIALFPITNMLFICVDPDLTSFTISTISGAEIPE